MSLAPPTPDAVRPRAGGRASLLVLAGWYGVLLASFGGYVRTLSAAVPAGCEVCDSDRSDMLLFGLYTGLPALFLAVMASLVLLWLVLVRVRLRSAALAGTVAAVPALIVVSILGGLALSG